MYCINFEHFQVDICVIMVRFLHSPTYLWIHTKTSYYFTQTEQIRNMYNCIHNSVLMYRVYGACRNLSVLLQPPLGLGTSTNGWWWWINVIAVNWQVPYLLADRPHLRIGCTPNFQWFSWKKKTVRLSTGINKPKFEINKS